MQLLSSALALTVAASFFLHAPLAAEPQLIDLQSNAPIPKFPPPITGAAVKCANGKAGDYPCSHVDLLSFLPIPAIVSTMQRDLGDPPLLVNDIWGWTDSATGREFALIGNVDGTSFVEVTDPVNPRYLGNLPLPPNIYRYYWRDIKVYQHYALIVADAQGPHGMQIFDLTQLRDVGSPRTFQETTRYTGFHAAHNLVINPETGYAYAVISSGGSLTCEGGLHMIDLRTPLQPAFAGCYADSTALDIHDAQCVVYHGPDRSYQGHELCFNAAGSAVSIADVTDKQQPKTISITTYPGVSYALQGWLSDDQRYFFLNEQPKEPEGTQVRIMVFDVNQVGKPVLIKEFLGTPAAAASLFNITDRNLYVRGSSLYQANYQAGLRVIDVRDPATPREVGYFDTTPQESSGNRFDITGAWSTYPFFKSGAIGISSVGEGLFLVRFTP